MDATSLAQLRLSAARAPASPDRAAYWRQTSCDVIRHCRVVPSGSSETPRAVERKRLEARLERPAASERTSPPRGPAVRRRAESTPLMNTGVATPFRASRTRTSWVATAPAAAACPSRRSGTTPPQ